MGQDDFDVLHRTLRIATARVHGIDKNYTKTRQDRLIELCPRAVRVLNSSSCSRQREALQSVRPQLRPFLATQERLAARRPRVLQDLALET